MATFVPKEREILLRHPILEELKQSPHYSYSFNNTLHSGLSERDRLILSSGYRPQRVEFYTRHNPHPTRVRHMKGLLDVPICCVEDNTARRLLCSPPSGEAALRLYKNLLDSAGRNELEHRTQLALSKALAQATPTPPPTRTPNSGQAGRTIRRNEYSQLNDDQILQLLCQILQTGSVVVCKAWLDQASEAEKAIVLNMLGLAARGVINYSGPANDIPSNIEQPPQNMRVWQQEQSQVGSQPHSPYDQRYSQADNEDPIVHIARELSRLASRQGYSMDEVYQLQRSRVSSRPRSATMEHPIPTGHRSKQWFRSRSASTVPKATSPPPPVGVTVTKQRLQKPEQRPPTRLKYVSTWNHH